MHLYLGIPSLLNGKNNPAYQRAYTIKTKGRAARERHQRRRAQLLRMYGGDPPTCVCCGESQEAFLSIDHLHGDGGEMRRRIGRGPVLVKYLLAERRSGVRVLCHNCNQARGQFGRCPHKDQWR